jgi:hypothetical protein
MRRRVTWSKALIWRESARGILFVIATLIGAYVGYWIGMQPDFIISVQPIMDSATPGAKVAPIIVVDLNPLGDILGTKRYRHQIMLFANIVNDVGPPPDIEIYFNPPGFDPYVMKGSSNVSKMELTIDENVRPGDYKIKIIAIGGDGKERNSMFILRVQET